MENYAPKIFFTSTWSMSIHKYGCAKFQPNPLFSSQQTATDSAAEGKKKEQKKKVGMPIGDPVGGRDDPIKIKFNSKL